ncbi:ATP-binding protein [Pseudodesulfovibrio karagichevae]|uniref:ATP-binding protein n=1 Tax=Pseudodesulfovibrio karagichevae TaxID=3239305 RepID=A0ABV4JZ32_9BACT
MKSEGQEFKVDTSPTKRIVGELTKDATVEACLFDLIDNSIDAARNTLLKKASNVIDGDTLPDASNADHTLPESYEGFQIDLTLNGERFALSDNCGGIKSEDLSNMVLRFGKQSTHKLGIGTFGVGLNRALFKLGKVTKLSTDTGEERSELVLDTEAYLKSDEWKLPAASFSSLGKIGTTIEVSQLAEDISLQFANRSEQTKLVEEIGRRYGNFIDKGLIIKFNNDHVKSHTIHIRKNGLFKGDYLFFKTDDGIAVHIEFGQHEDHRFTIEEGYNLETNKRLTNEYGWSILCNDRAVVLSDQTRKTGWDNKFHTEFYGFVGIVRFVCPDASKLPWTTTKTDVDLNNKSYQKALVEMQEFASKWRKISRDVKKIRKDPNSPISPITISTEEKSKNKTNVNNKNKSKGKKKNTGTKTNKSPTTRVAQNQFWEILPPDVDEILCSDKQRTLVHEAKSLNISDCTYSGLALIRILFETSVVHYFIRHKKIDQLKQFAIDEREANGTTLSSDFKKKMVPKLDEMLLFMTKNRESWAPDHSNYLTNSLNLTTGHKGILNGVVHDPFQTVGLMRAMQIRDEIMPILRHLIET